MFSFLVMIGFFWLFVNGIGLAFRLTWGAAKVIGSLLMALALPVLIVCVLFAGGVLLLVPLFMVGIAVAVLKA